MCHWCCTALAEEPCMLLEASTGFGCCHRINCMLADNHENSPAQAQRIVFNFKHC
jgi:hypothetical protein